MEFPLFFQYDWIFVVFRIFPRVYFLYTAWSPECLVGNCVIIMDLRFCYDGICRS